jgi:hypothetical protein
MRAMPLSQRICLWSLAAGFAVIAGAIFGATIVAGAS